MIAERARTHPLREAAADRGPRSARCSTTSARGKTCWSRPSGTPRAPRSPRWKPKSAGIDDPWDQLETILTRSLTGYEPEAPDAGRLWIESWHFGIRDPEMRADALRDNTAWRRLVADVVRRGIERGMFSGRYDADKVAVLAVAAADGMGIPLPLGDPDITASERSSRRAGRVT